MRLSLSQPCDNCATTTSPPGRRRRRRTSYDVQTINPRSENSTGLPQFLLPVKGGAT